MDGRSNTSSSVRYMVELAVLIAVLLVLEITGLGMIKTPGLEFTIMHVPVILGAIVLGPAAGAVLGGTFGLLSFWECFGKSWFGASILSINPIGAFLTCVPTRLLMGLLCGLIFKALHSIGPLRRFGSFLIASLCGALLNTLFFMTTLVLFFYHTDFIQSLAADMGTSNVLLFVVAFVGLQGLLEALICGAAGTIISRALYKACHLE